MDQLTWLQQSLQKPRLSSVARALAEAFPRPDVPRVVIGTDDASKGVYNSATKKTDEHLEYPGFILRYREMNSTGNYVGYGWARPHQDHVGVLGGQVTVANDGFMVGVELSKGLGWLQLRNDTKASPSFVAFSPKDAGAANWSHDLFNFASVVPVLSGLLTSGSSGPLTDSDGKILLTAPLTFEEPEARGFTSIQWLTQSETRRP